MKERNLRVNAELRDKIFEFQLNIHRYKSIEAARRRTPTKNCKDDLKCSEINLVCIHGGKDFKTTSKGERPGQW